MAIIEGWLPPSREHWESAVFAFQLFPLVTILQWMHIYGTIGQLYRMGKTATESRFNIPGKIAWAVMETPGYLIVLYCVYVLPEQEGIHRLPLMNWTMAGMFTIHYVYRSIVFAILSPSISDMNVVPFAGACVFNVLNGLSIGGWLGAYGPITKEDWQGQRNAVRVEVGMMIWAIGLLANIYHDDELREIRRAAARDQEQRAKIQGDDDKKAGKRVDKVYKIPDNGLFRVILYAHYFSEWLEWAGFWIVGGWGCIPARIFLVNEISTMLPRAVEGKQWYAERFGKEKIGSKKAVIPGLI